MSAIDVCHGAEKEPFLSIHVQTHTITSFIARFYKPADFRELMNMPLAALPWTPVTELVAFFASPV